MTASRRLPPDELLSARAVDHAVVLEDDVRTLLHQARDRAAKILAEDPDQWMRARIAAMNAPAHDAESTSLAPVPAGTVVQSTQPPERAVIPSSPSDAVAAAILERTPNVFGLERMASGVAALLFEAVRRWKLYEVAGFKTMAEYAEKRLGVRGKANYKAYARAGTVVWTHYPALAIRAIEALTGVGVTFVTPMDVPPLPTVSLLREVPGALRRMDPVEHDALLRRVEMGEVTHEELRQAGRNHPAPQHNAVDLDDQHRDGNGKPDAFLEVPDLRRTARALREAEAALEPVVRVWTENPEPDVNPILPVIETVLRNIQSTATVLENGLTPSAICSTCTGSGCKTCRGMGWVPREPGALEALLRQPARARSTNARKKRSQKPARR